MLCAGPLQGWPGTLFRTALSDDHLRELHLRELHLRELHLRELLPVLATTECREAQSVRRHGASGGTERQEAGLQLNVPEAAVANLDAGLRVSFGASASFLRRRIPRRYIFGCAGSGAGPTCGGLSSKAVIAISANRRTCLNHDFTCFRSCPAAARAKGQVAGATPQVRRTRKVYLQMRCTCKNESSLAYTRRSGPPSSGEKYMNCGSEAGLLDERHRWNRSSLTPWTR
jgi:hypothetical protein